MDVQVKDDTLKSSGGSVGMDNSGSSSNSSSG